MVLAAGFEAELGEDPGDVLLHRPFGDHQLAGDRGVRAALGHQAQHLALARGGEAAGATVVVETEDVSAGPVAGAVDELVRKAEADPQVSGPVEVETSRDGTVAAVQTPTVGSGSDATATRAMERVREQLVPATFADVGDAKVNVAGAAAESKDFNDLLSQRLPIVFAFVLGLAFLLMLVTFRSIVVPVEAIMLNLLSVGAAYGVLVLVFQDGLGSRCSAFTPTAASAPGCRCSLRHPLRPLDGLPRADPQPGPRVRRPGDGDRRGGRAGDNRDRGHGDRRRS